MTKLVVTHQCEKQLLLLKNPHSTVEWTTSTHIVVWLILIYNFQYNSALQPR